MSQNVAYAGVFSDFRGRRALCPRIVLLFSMVELRGLADRCVSTPPQKRGLFVEFVCSGVGHHAPAPLLSSLFVVPPRRNACPLRLSVRKNVCPLRLSVCIVAGGAGFFGRWEGVDGCKWLKYRSIGLFYFNVTDLLVLVFGRGSDRRLPLPVVIGAEEACPPCGFLALRM